MATKQKPLEVLLTGHPGWAPWDFSGELGERLSELAWEAYRSIFSEGICDTLVMDLAGPLRERRHSKQDWSGRSISWDDAERICAGLKNDADGLELTKDAILGVITGAYETALTPSDRDITDAMTDAIEKMADNFEIDQDFWAPLLDRGAEPEDIVRGLFEHTVDGVFVDRHVSYRRKPGYYDRHLVFDFWKSDVVKEFLKVLPDDYDMKTTLDELEKDFRVIVAGFLSRFFSILEKEMSGDDVENRVEWRRAWKDMIAGVVPPGSGGYAVDHEPTIDKIRKELLVYLAQSSQEAIDEDDEEEEET